MQQIGEVNMKKWIIPAMAAWILTVGTAIPNVYAAEKEKEVQNDSTGLEQKIDEVIEKQNLILERLDTMEETLRIMKLRIGRKRG